MNNSLKTYTQNNLKRRITDYATIVLPFLFKYGYDIQKMINLFKNGYVRLRWGKDWNNFTIHLTNPHNEPTCAIDNLIHSIWNGNNNVPNTLVMTCFINANKVSSIVITDLYTLSESFKNYGIRSKTINSINGQEFLTLPFSHPSLSKNIWGIGIK